MLGSTRTITYLNYHEINFLWNYCNVEALDVKPLDEEPLDIELMDVEPLDLEPLDIEPLDEEPLDVYRDSNLIRNELLNHLCKS